MLIIEIALGIVLAVIILIFWRQIIGFGVIAIIAMIAISILGIGGYFLYNNFDAVSPFLPLIILLILLYGLWMLIKEVGKRISVVTLKKWDLSSGDISGILFSVPMFLLGLFFLSKTLITGDYEVTHLYGGGLLVIAGVIVWFANKKEIKRTRALRAIKASYKE
jgi:hypothetical protein